MRRRYCLDCDDDISALRSVAKRCHQCAFKHKRNQRTGTTNSYKEPSLKQKLAAMILLHLKIPHEQAKAMNINDIMKMVEWDHYPVARNTALSLKWKSRQTNHPSNLQPLTKKEHRAKTSAVDVPQAAKGKRLSKDHEEHRRRMLAPDKGEPPPMKSRWPKGRKLQGRGFKKRDDGA